jgi:hypothetical protein
VLGIPLGDLVASDWIFPDESLPPVDPAALSVQRLLSARSGKQYSG